VYSGGVTLKISYWFCANPQVAMEVKHFRLLLQWRCIMQMPIWDNFKARSARFLWSVQYSDRLPQVSQPKRDILVAQGLSTIFHW